MRHILVHVYNCASSVDVKQLISSVKRSKRSGGSRIWHWVGAWTLTILFKMHLVRIERKQLRKLIVFWHENNHRSAAVRLPLPPLVKTYPKKTMLLKNGWIKPINHHTIIRNAMLWNHLALWAWNYVVWRHVTCAWTIEFVDLKWYATLLNWITILLWS